MLLLCSHDDGMDEHGRPWLPPRRPGRSANRPGPSSTAAPATPPLSAFCFLLCAFHSSTISIAYMLHCSQSPNDSHYCPALRDNWIQVCSYHYYVLLLYTIICLSLPHDRLQPLAFILHRIVCSLSDSMPLQDQAQCDVLFQWWPAALGASVG